ncbi:MAG: glycosyltransferase family 2 protein [Candidatus Omnitrophica bacterium]|nr:glycosyltransferase family 2 protein [Candidatus Omnitrophota bacterium]
MKKVSVVTACFNEEGNIGELYSRVKKAFAGIPGYSYEHIFIDNASRDNTVKILKDIAANDKNVKVIVNLRNFGAERSGRHALLNASGDAVIGMVADLQDPPELIGEFIKKWEEGYKIVVGIKVRSEGNRFFYFLRKFYYKLLNKLSHTEQIVNFCGFGLYDREFVEIIRKLNDPYPYLRGLITEVGFPRAEIKYTQPKRKRGRSSYNLYSLYETAVLGFTSYSMVPLRLSVFIGFLVAIISLGVALFYFILKLLFWNSMQMGTAPIIIGIFFFSAVQLFFIGILGEYVGAIYTQVKNRPLVFEKERINF